MNVKLALIPLALLAAGSVFAADEITSPGGGIDASASAKTATYKAHTGTPPNYVVTDFKFGVSANVGLKSKENTTAIAVQTANLKGRNNYSGISDGGSVAQCGNPTTGATAPEVREPSLDQPNGCTSS